MVAAACLVALWLLGRWEVWQASPYVLVTIALWAATLQSGVHPAIAGMTAGLLMAAHAPRRQEVEGAASLFRAFRQSPRPDVGYTAKAGLQRAISVNERLQTVLHPWASYLVVPLFALANAGVDLRGGLMGAALRSPITWGVVIGLVAGKLTGIGLGSLLAVRLRLGRLPQGVGEGQVVGGAALSGIGFTVALLITGWPSSRRRAGTRQPWACWWRRSWRSASAGWSSGRPPASGASAPRACRWSWPSRWTPAGTTSAAAPTPR